MTRVIAVSDSHGAAGKPPVLILVEAQKNRRPGLTIEPDILLDSGAAQYGG